MSEFDLADFLRSQAAQFAPETESYKDRVRAAAEIERLRAELAENEGVIAVWRRRAAEAEAECARLREALTSVEILYDMPQAVLQTARAALAGGEHE